MKWAVVIGGDKLEIERDKMVIGIDQSYKRFGITVLKYNRYKNKILIDTLSSFPLEDMFGGDSTKKRNYIREQLQAVIHNYKNWYDITVICERIRLKSYGTSASPKGFINEQYIKTTGALTSAIYDVCHENELKLFEVDTRSWKSAIIGTSKPMENPYGIDERKYPTILHLKKSGLMKYIAIPYNGHGKKGVIVINKNGKKKKYKVDDDAADSYCIAKYGFLPAEKQKLKQVKL